MEYSVINIDGSEGRIRGTTLSDRFTVILAEGTLRIGGVSSITISGSFTGAFRSVRQIGSWQSFTKDYNRPTATECVCKTKEGGIIISRYASRKQVWLSLEGGLVDVVAWYRQE